MDYKCEAFVKSDKGNFGGTDCECKTWCGDGRPPLTQHHRNCPARNLESESMELVSSLIKGIENWAADEDGVHPAAWDAYCRAIVFVGDLAKLKVVIEKDAKECVEYELETDSTKETGENTRAPAQGGPHERTSGERTRT
jgi:hypothetical protein